MKRFVKCLIMLLVVQTVTGCTYIKGKKAIIKNRDMGYLDSHEVSPIQLPAGMDSTLLGDELVIPPAVQTWDKQPPTLIPANSLAARMNNR